MATATKRIERHAAFYRGYLADDRDLTAVAVVLGIGIALWLLFYLLAAVGPQPRAERSALTTRFETSQPVRP
jgi:hypothetical protein